MEYKVVTRTPTDVLIDRILQRYAGQNVDIKVAYVRVKTSAGVTLGQATVSTTDWSNHKVTKTVTITQAGTVAYFSLDSSDGAELFKYMLANPFSVNVNDTVTINWTIGIQTTTTVYWVASLLEAIEGQTVDLKIQKIFFVAQGEVKDTILSPAVTADTTNNKLVIQVTLTPSESYTYDEVRFVNASDFILLKLSVSASLSYGTTVTITFYISITT